MQDVSKERAIELFNELAARNGSPMELRLNIVLRGFGSYIERHIKSGYHCDTFKIRVIGNAQTSLLGLFELSSAKTFIYNTAFPAVLTETSKEYEDRAELIIMIPTKVRGVIDTYKVKKEDNRYTTWVNYEFVDIDFSSITSFKNMFNHDDKLESVVFNNCDLSNINDLSNMFVDCTHLNCVKLSGLGASRPDRQKIKMEYFIDECNTSSLECVDLGDLTPNIIEPSIRPIINWSMAKSWRPSRDSETIGKILKATKETKDYIIDRWVADEEMERMAISPIKNTNLTKCLRLWHEKEIKEVLRQSRKHRLLELVLYEITLHKACAQMSILRMSDYLMGEVLGIISSVHELRRKLGIESRHGSVSHFTTSMIRLTDDYDKRLLKTLNLNVDYDTIVTHLAARASLGTHEGVETGRTIYVVLTTLEDVIAGILQKKWECSVAIPENIDRLYKTYNTIDALDIPHGVFKLASWGVNSTEVLSTVANMFSLNENDKYFTIGAAISSVKQELSEISHYKQLIERTFAGVNYVNLLERVKKAEESAKKYSLLTDELNEQIEKAVIAHFADVLREKGCYEYVVKQVAPKVGSSTRAKKLVVNNGYNKQIKCPNCYGVIKDGVCIYCGHKV